MSNPVLWRSRRWKRGDSPSQVLEEDYLSLDTETEFIVKGDPIKPVLMQVGYPKSRLVDVVWHTDIRAYLDSLYSLRSNMEIVMHNAPFDIKVTGHEGILQSFLQGNITDIGLRYLLTTMEDGSYTNEWNLEYLVKKYLHRSLPKDEEIRFTFKQDMALTDRHVQYAVNDAIATADLREYFPHKLATEDEQLRGSFVLSEISDNGMLVDMEYMDNVSQRLTKKVESLKEELSWYRIRPGVPGCGTELQRQGEFIEKRYGVKLPRTDSGKYGFNEEIWEALAGKTVPLAKIQSEYTHVNKMVSTYLNKKHIGTDGRVHPYFTPIIRTGRTSASGPSVQNIPREEGIRGIYIAPPGHALVSVDYNQLELVVLAEHCGRFHKRSAMQKLINEGHDLHSWLGEKLREMAKKGPEEKKAFRQRSKACNFGFGNELWPK